METTIPVIEKFLEEAVILQDFRHANVLETLGLFQTQIRLRLCFLTWPMETLNLLSR